MKKLVMKDSIIAARTEITCLQYDAHLLGVKFRFESDSIPAYLNAQDARRLGNWLLAAANEMDKEGK